MAFGWRNLLTTVVNVLQGGRNASDPATTTPVLSGVEVLGSELARARSTLAAGKAQDVVAQLDEMLARLGIFTAAAWAVRGAAHEQLKERSPRTKAYRRAIKAYDEAEAAPSPEEALAIVLALVANDRRADAADLLGRTADTFGDSADVLTELAAQRELLDDKPAAAAAHGRLARLVSGFDRVEALRTALRLDSTNRDYRLGLAEALLAVGEATEAVDVLRDADESTALDADVIAALAEGLERSGEGDEALARADDVLERVPDHRRALLVRARLLGQRGELEPALEAVDKVLAANSFDTDARAARFTLLLQAGTTDDLLRDLDAVAADDPQQAVVLAEDLFGRGLNDLARAAFSELVELAPDDPRAWLGLGRVAYAESDPDVEAVLEKAAAVAADSASADDEAEALAWLGETRRRAGDTTGALEALERALELRPNLPWALACRGRAHASRGETSDAIRDLSAAVKASPGLTWVYLDLAEQLRLSGDLVSASEALDVAAEANDDSAFLYGTRGQIERARGAEEAAMASYRAGFEREAAPWLALELADLLLTRAEHVDRFEEALEVVDRALEQTPDALALCRTKGEILRLLGRPFEGLEQTGRYLDAVPDDPTALATRAHLLVDVGSPDAALELVGDEWDDEFTFLSARSAAVRALTVLDRQSEAIDVLAGLLERFPDDNWLLRMRVALRCDLRQLDAALAEAEELLAANPEDRWMSGCAGFCERRLDPPALERAIIHLRVADSGDPPDVGIKFELAEALTQLADPEAAARYQEMIDIVQQAGRPDDWLVGLAAWASLRLDRVEEAVAGFETAARLDPSRPAHRLSLGLALLRAGRGRLGIDEYEAAIAQAERLPDARRAAVIVRDAVANLRDVISTDLDVEAAGRARELMAAAIDRLDRSAATPAGAAAPATESAAEEATRVP